MILIEFEEFDLNIKGHNFIYETNYVCKKCGCIAHIEYKIGHPPFYIQRITLDQLKWINLLSCNENMIKNIIE